FVILLLQYIILLYFNIFDTSYGNLIQVLSKVIVSLFYIIAFKDIMKRKLGSFLIIYFIVFFILLLNLLIFHINSLFILFIIFIMLLQYIILLYFNIFDTSYGNLIQVLSKVIVSLFYIIAFKDIMKRKLGSFLIIYFIVFFILLLNLLIFPENSLYIQSIIF